MAIPTIKLGHFIVDTAKSVYESVWGNDPAPSLDLGESNKKLVVAVQKIAKAYDNQLTYKVPWELAEDVFRLEPVVQIPDIIPTVRNLSDGTIVPQMDAGVVVNSMAGVVISSVPSSRYSPAPASILGLGNSVGSILIMLGKVVVAEIAADVSQDTMKRIGQRVHSAYRIRGKTGASPSGQSQRITTQVKPVLGRSGFLPNRKNYDGPCEWWEFWCWIV